MPHYVAARTSFCCAIMLLAHVQIRLRNESITGHLVHVINRKLTLRLLLWEQPGLVCPGWVSLWSPSSSSGCSPRWSPESLRRGRLRGGAGRRGGSSWIRQRGTVGHSHHIPRTSHPGKRHSKVWYVIDLSTLGLP